MYLANLIRFKNALLQEFPASIHSGIAGTSALCWGVAFGCGSPALRPLRLIALPILTVKCQVVKDVSWAECRRLSADCNLLHAKEFRRLAADRPKFVVFLFILPGVREM